MKYVFKMFYSPETEHETITASANTETATVANENTDNKTEKLSFLQKIRKALQEWSNGDQADQNFDNTRV